MITRTPGPGTAGLTSLATTTVQKAMGPAQSGASVRDGVGALASLLWGDFSGVAASVPVALGVLRYSREFEREADEFALAFLRAQDLSARPLYQFFTQLRALESRRGVADIPDFMSTHPSTEERLERLRREIR